jgi:hypothetical protein
MHTCNKRVLVLAVSLRSWLGGTDDTGVEYMQMAAEKIDAPDASFDIVSVTARCANLCAGCQHAPGIALALLDWPPTPPFMVI